MLTDEDKRRIEAEERYRAQVRTQAGEVRTAQGTRGVSATVGYLGATVLAVGVFMPIISLPLVGSISYYRGGNGDSLLVLLMALASAALTFFGLARANFLTGGVSAALVAYLFFNVQRAVGSARDTFDGLFGQDAAAQQFGDLFLSTAMQLQWGWLVLLAGCVLLIASAATAGQRN